MPVAKKKFSPWRAVLVGAFLTVLALVLLNSRGGRIDAQESDANKINVKYKGEGALETLVINPQTDTHKDQQNYFDLTCVTAQKTCAESASINAFFTNARAQLTGLDPPESSGSGNTQSDSQKNSLLASLGTLIGATYTPPASGVYYVSYVLDNMGLANPVYAQGTGFYGLSPFLSAWRLFRNFMYVFFSVLIIAIAVSILVRQSFSSKTTVSAQQALPGIIITLLAITFSYSIAGFMIDLMYWVMFAVGSFVFVQGGGGGDAYGAVEYKNAAEIVNTGFFTMAASFITGGWSTAFSSVNGMIEGMFSSTGVGYFGGKIIGFIGGAIGAVIVTVIMVVNVFKLFILLLKSYAMVLVSTVFSPFILAMQVFQPQTFKKWVLGIVANLSPFVLTFFTLLFLGICNAAFENDINGWVPPFVMGSDISGQTVGATVSLGMLLALPTIAENIKKKIDGGGGFMSQMGDQAINTFKQGALGTPGKIAKGIAGGMTGGVVSGISGVASRTPGTSVLGGFMGGIANRVGGGVTKAGTKIKQAAINVPGADIIAYNAMWKKADAIVGTLGATTPGGARTMPAGAEGLVGKYGYITKEQAATGFDWHNKYKTYGQWVKAGSPPLS